MRKLLPLLIVIASVIPMSLLFADVIDGEELTDPTRPIFLDNIVISNPIRTVTPGNYDITFIRASGTSPMAVINNQQVTIGDVIDGALVVSIDRNGATLLIGEEETRFDLYRTGIKAPVVER